MPNQSTFSDGVLAFLTTVLVLDLRPPTFKAFLSLWATLMEADAMSTYGT